jgi:N-methylhydantoinase A
MVDKPPDPERPDDGVATPRTHRPTWSPARGRMVETPIWDGPSLPPGSIVTGPGILEHPGTTIVLLEGQDARIDERGHTRITVSGGGLA